MPKYAHYRKSDGTVINAADAHRQDGVLLVELVPGANTGSILTVAPQDEIRTHIANGTMYATSRKFDIAANQSFLFQGITPSNASIHILHKQITTNREEVLVELLEQPEILSPGQAPITKFNLNRQKPDNSQFTLLASPTIGNVGSIIERVYLPGTPNTGQRSSGMYFSSSVERILRKNAIYVLRITNNGETACSVLIDLMWYEA